MTQAGAPRKPHDGSSPSARDGDAQLEELRRLLLRPDRERVRRVEERVNDPEAMVARVLPRAVTRRSQQDKALSRALMPTVEDAVQTSVRKNPNVLIDIIFPILGPAIRKAIAKAISDLVQGINRGVEAALTPRGIRWRFEAWRTGRSYGEVVLAHSLVYRVEQAFLIHRESGLLLKHVVTPSLAIEDPDLVSGMFTAIQDFVGDSFEVAEGGSLEQVKIGDLTLLGEYGPRAVLALVVRGAVPPDLRERMQETVEQVHSEWRADLEGFRGDSAPFEATEPLLEECLVSRERERRKSSTAPVLAGVLLIGVLMVLAWGWFRARDEDDRWQTYLDRLDREPGIVVIRAQASDDRYALRGLRDPLAADPNELCREAGLDPQAVDAGWEAFFASHPPFVLERVRRALDPPDTVVLRLEDGILRARGWASTEWVREAGRLAPLLPGVASFDAGELAHDDLEALRLAVATATVLFQRETADLPPAGLRSMDDLVARVRRLDQLVRQLGGSVVVEVVGLAWRWEASWPAGGLSLARARMVTSRLEAEEWVVTRFRARESAGDPPAWTESRPTRSGPVPGVWLRATVETEASAGRPTR